MRKDVDLQIDNPGILSKDAFYAAVLSEQDTVDEVLTYYEADYEDFYLYLYLNEKDQIVHLGYSIRKNCMDEFSEVDFPVKMVTYEKLHEIALLWKNHENVSEKIREFEREELGALCPEDKTCQDEEETDPYEGSNQPYVAFLIRRWLKKTDFNAFCKEITDRVMGQEETEIIVLNIYNYLRCIAARRKHNNNMLLAAPSGCGKTETYRAVRDYFKKKIPELVVYQLDMTTITEEGFTGKNSKDLVYALKSEDKGIGIAFLDEFDKKLIPSYAKGGTNVNLAVQSQILTLIEGRMLAEKGKEEVDTSNTLFIGMGSYDFCRKEREEAKCIGFQKNARNSITHYTEITREDMIRLGGSYELIGRFSSVINYHELAEEIIEKLINRFVAQEEESIGCDILLSDDMKKLLHEMANGEYGCRSLKNVIHQSAYKAFLQICKAGENVGRCQIYIHTPDYVEFTIDADIDH